jgi:hypothetical protein
MPIWNSSILSHAYIIRRSRQGKGAILSVSLGKKSEDNLVMLWKEANDCIKRLAGGHGFSIVLGYGEPLGNGLMDLFPNVKRKLDAMDGGATVSLYVHGSANLTDTVTQTLNHWYDLRQNQLQGTPTR